MDINDIPNVIRWREGVPPEEGWYFVVTKDDKIRSSYWFGSNSRCFLSGYTAKFWAEMPKETLADVKRKWEAEQRLSMEF